MLDELFGQSRACFGRDNAHHFANDYHQFLMKRRIAESIFDDCPSVSLPQASAPPAFSDPRSASAEASG
ncbi:MAG: hypothetical protein WCP06_02980 [Verrucomicrobiota bacterium]